MNITNITYVELDLVGHFGTRALIVMTHVVLLRLITREDADMSNVCVQKTVDNRVAKTPSTTGN